MKKVLVKETLAKETFQVPFDDDGDMMPRYEERQIYNPKTKVYDKFVPNMVDNYAFEATLSLYKASSNRMWFIDDNTEKRYCMFLSELKNTLCRASVVGNNFTARWTFRRGGETYSIKVADPSPCPHCGTVPPFDDNGTVCHECSGARFWSTLGAWEASVKMALTGEDTDSSRVEGGKTISLYTPSAMRKVENF